MTRLLLESSMITGFVAAMMLLIEYFHVVSLGRWSQWLARGRVAQYLLASLLGAVPGCLGAFTVVTLYSHGVVSLGAVVAAMIATSGDEAFVMFALIPRTALALTGMLLVLAFVTAWVVDFFASGRRMELRPCPALVVHEGERRLRFSASEVVAQWRNCSAPRGILTTALGLFVVAIAAGRIGPAEWDWVRMSLLAVSVASVLVTATVPDHFLEEHLWRHVARKHAPRVFLWTLGALAASGPLEQLLQVGGGVAGSRWVVLVLACAVGLIPESGPHLIFVTLYAQHAVPLGVLLASSIVQDGHGMLPMLAHSRRAFLVVKAINFVVGLAVGAVALGCGW
jgi:hypothetical protein